MLAAPIRLAAILLSLVVALGFVLFAVDETREASNRTTAEIRGDRATRSADPTPREERDREAAHSGPRELVDDANDVLLAPFAGLVADDANVWARRSVPALVALLVYGLGLGFLARIARVR